LSPVSISTGTGDFWWVYYPDIHSDYSGSLSLAIPPWVGAMSTGDDFSYWWGRNSEFCVAVGPVTIIAGIKSAGC